MNHVMPIGPDGTDPGVAAGGQCWAVRTLAQSAPLPEYVAISYAWSTSESEPRVASEKTSSPHAS
jgi:hypothetical protein